MFNAFKYFLYSKKNDINNNLLLAFEINSPFSKLKIASLFSSIHLILSLKDNLSNPKQLAPNMGIYLILKSSSNWTFSPLAKFNKALANSTPW